MLYSFYEPAARRVSTAVRALLARRGLDDLAYTERSTKTLASIVSKLNRERSRLFTVQDIVGCRIIVPDMMEQEALRYRLVMSDETRGFEKLWLDDLAFLGNTEPLFRKFTITDRSSSH